MGCSSDGGQGSAVMVGVLRRKAVLSAQKIAMHVLISIRTISAKKMTTALVPNPTRETLTETVSGTAATRAPLMPQMTKMVTGFVGEDNCPELYNASQVDSDNDGLGNACDVCPTEAGGDADGDQLCDAIDNCPDDFNLSQDDTDRDGKGDICDPCIDDH